MTKSSKRYNQAIDYDPDQAFGTDSYTTTAKGGGTQSLGKAAHEKSAEDKPAKELPSFIRFFLDKRTHAVTGICLILIATYLVISAMSYFNSASVDQSKLNNLTVEEMVQSNASVENIAGPAGASVSHLLVTHGLGIGSFVLIIYLFIIGLVLIGAKKKIHFWRLTLKCLISAIGISLIIGLIDLYFNSENVIPLGGYHGRYINIWLIERIQWIGAFGVSALMVVILTYLYFNSIIKLFNRLRVAYSAARVKTDQALDAQANNLDDNIDDDHSDTTDNEAATDTLQPSQQEEDRTSTEPDRINVSFDDTERSHEDSVDGHVDINDLLKHNADSKNDTSTLADSTETDEIPSFDNTITTVDVPTVVDEPRDDTDKGEADNTESGPKFNINVPAIEEGTEDTSQLYDPTAELSRYQRPSLDLLINRTTSSNSVDCKEQEENKERITKTLQDYGIPISQIQATVGPTVTLYEIVPAKGVRISTIKHLEDDIALSLSALGIRIIAPIPGKGTIGIEVPNKDPQIVSMRSVIGSKAFQECKYELPMAMGATISNDIYIADLAKMPHLLVAGATGQGKSVGLNAVIASLLYKKHPAEVKFVLIDPKMVEFSLYSKLQNHFIAQLEDEDEAVITNTEKVERTLNSLCVEMDNRYNLLKDAEVRSIKEYNAKFVERRLNPQKGHRYLPYIVIIVDEFADLIMTSGKNIETPIARIAQKARAVGMHMIIATQRPSANVITGVIKANFPGRIAFRVSQMIDSKTILDRPGANQLIGRGDMLFSHNGSSVDRVQCAFIDTPEVEAIVNNINSQMGFDHPYFLPDPPTADSDIALGSITDRDPLFDDAARFLCSTGDTASTSSLQRRFSIGYNRAGKIMDQLESAGIVSPAQGSKPRNVLVDLIQLDSLLSDK